MNRILFLIGVVLFIAGMALISASLAINPNFHGHSSKIYPSSNYTTEQNGLYIIKVPSRFTAQETDFIFVPSPSLKGIPAKFALVNQSSLSKLNATNFETYSAAKPYNNTESIYFDNVKPGSYAFVEPHNDIIAFGATPTVPLKYAGYLGFSGGASAFFGFVTIIVSLLMKKKEPPFAF